MRTASLTICFLILHLAYSHAENVPGPMCQKRVEKIAHALRKLNQPPRVKVYGLPDVMQFVQLDGARYYTRHLPQISVHRGKITSAGAEIGLVDDVEDGSQPAKLRESLKNHWYNWRASNPKRKLVKRVSLIVGPDVRWTVIAAVIRNLAAIGVQRVGVLVSVVDPTPPMPPSRATPDLQAWKRELENLADPGKDARLLLGTETSIARRAKAHWLRATKDCPRLTNAIEKVVQAEKAKLPIIRDPREIAPAIINSVKKALIACRCRADLPSIHARLHLAFRLNPTGVVWFHYRKKGRRIARLAKEPWRDTVAKWLRRHPRKIISGRFVAAP